ncbi:hypothetical protein JHK84_027949 [Glycine max]|nr:hypothetical protein JHK85_028358 [Glycine max]KAG5003696.1 hypothetical protein JHK86_027835 [Glycine max]KAG5151477.1 hypothetical protein JHK84_027949 [Glycine max]
MVEHLKVGSKASRQEASLFCVANGFPVRTLSLCKHQLLVGWGMASTDVRGILTAFNPSLDFFAITTGDGRVKIWDTLKGQVHTEFADITSTHSTATTLHHKSSINGHLALDYTCIKWFSFEEKRKRKHISSLLVLGTGGGDVLALDVASAQLTWRLTDCHPGGVRVIASSANVSSIYTAGVDGMVCVIDFMTGNLLEKFKASTKPVSCMSVSPGIITTVLITDLAIASLLKSDGNTLATAAAQLKIFNCSNHKKIQKFSGHPGSLVYFQIYMHILYQCPFNLS